MIPSAAFSYSSCLQTKAVEANVSDAEKNCRDALYRVCLRVCGATFVNPQKPITLQVMLRNVEERMQREPSSQFNEYLMPNHAPTKAFFGPISELAGASGVRLPAKFYEPVVLPIYRDGLQVADARSVSIGIRL